MSDTNVNLVIRGRDEASKSLNNIGRNLKKFRGEVSRTIRTAAISAGIVFGTREIIRAGKAMVTAASFAQESGNRFDEVFKKQAEASDAWAGQLASDTNRSKIRIKDSMALLMDTFVPLGLTREKAAELSGDLVQLGLDVASFKDVADADVIENFTSALVGQSKAVLKYGIVTNITALKQELLRQGIKKSFEELSTQEKVLLRYNVIMRSTRDAQGDLKRTSRAYANELKALKDTIFEASAAMGSMPLPFLATAFRELRLNIESSKKVLLNWGLSAEIVWASAQLAFANFKGDFNHFFDVTAPAALDHFKKNWKDIVTDAMLKDLSNLEAIGDNAFRFLFETKDLLSGDEFDFRFIWDPIPTGFESAMGKMPGIAKRAMSDVEKELTENLRALQRRFDDLSDPDAPPSAPSDTGALPDGTSGLLGRNRRGPSAIGGRFLTFNTSARANPQVQIARQVVTNGQTLRQLLAAVEKGIRLDERRRRQAGLSALSFE